MCDLIDRVFKNYLVIAKTNTHLFCFASLYLYILLPFFNICLLKLYHTNQGISLLTNFIMLYPHLFTIPLCPFTLSALKCMRNVQNN